MMSNCVNGDDQIEGTKELGEMRGAVRKNILFREDFGGVTKESGKQIHNGWGFKLRKLRKSFPIRDRAKVLGPSHDR